MTALTAARNTKSKVGNVFDFPVKAATTCIQGGIAVLDAGYAAPGRTATTLIAVGLFVETVTAVAAGDAKARVEAGIFKFANSSAGDLIAQANVGADCYIVDDQTVALTNGGATRSRAGKVVGVDADGVWVQLGLGL
jgi:predicted RecA/RadA family phage recombinase